MGSAMKSLIIDDFWMPEIAPEEYSPASNIVAWRTLHEGNIVLEIFRRNNCSFGYQYQAWVAWRDAGNEVRGHGWHEIPARVELVSDCILETCKLAGQDAAELCLVVTGEWVNTTADT